MIFLDSDKKEQLKLLELLQFNELRVYEKYLIILEDKFNNNFINNNDTSNIDEMLGFKKDMMEKIDGIEADLGPLRKRVSAWINELASPMYSETAVRVENIKKIDLQIIDVINKISRAEQEIIKEIKNHMDSLQDSLKEMDAKKKIAKQYNNQAEKLPRQGSSFDFSG